MAVCSVCNNIFDNLDGNCPFCGAKYGADLGERSCEDILKEAMNRIQCGQVSDAQGLLSEAARKDPDNPRYQFYLGSVLYKLGDHYKAYQVWQKADRLDPHNPRIEKCLLAARQRISEKEER